MTVSPTTSLTPIYLRCEYLVNPLGIDVQQPRLSWILHAAQSAQRGQRQTAYQLLVASTQALLAANVGDLWDSEKCSSAQSAHVAYEGASLSSGIQCWWKVRIWDNADIPSNYSEAAHWEMGLLSPDDWQAQWISCDSQQVVSDTHLQLPGLKRSPYFRKTLTLTQQVVQARLYVTAKGVYESSINGQRVGDAVLTPGWTDYHKRIQYQVYDVTSFLRDGKNMLEAVLAPGWYSGYVGFPVEQKGYERYGNDMSLLYQLRIDYADGTSETIGSDETWQGSTGPILFSDLLMGETYDARLEQRDWQFPVMVKALDHAVALVPDYAEPVRVTEHLGAKHVTQLSPNVHIVDMGQNMVGRVRLRMRGNIGTEVRLRFAEILNSDGTLYTENLRSARQTDTYILKGEGQEIFEPHFTFHGFRYIEVTGYPGTLKRNSIMGRVMHSDTLSSGSFECSSELVNQLQRNILWGQRGNFLSVPTDCPQRDERLGWMGDAQIFVHTASYNMDVAAFFTKWMHDVVDAQSAEGGFPDVAPRLAPVTKDGSPAWGDAGIIVPWTIYQMYGDKRMLEQHYDAMARWIGYLQDANPELLWKNKLNNNYGDWLSIAADTPKEVLATAYFAYDALLLSRIARVLAHYADAERYDALFHNIRKAFCDAYVSSDGKIEGETQTVYVLALHMHLLPPDLRSLAARHLVEDIEKKGWHLSTGFVGVGYLCPVLTEAGYVDVAYRLLLNETFPSWGYSIKHGATTIWERWDGWTEEHGFQDYNMNSFNHYSLGSVGQWLFQYVAGINMEQRAVGEQRCVIHPYPGSGLSYAKATYNSVFGAISSHWIQEKSGFTLRVTLPATMTAIVYLPLSEGTPIRENGKRAEEAEGVTYLREEDGCAVFEIGSGEYEFVCAIEGVC